ncbi:MAG TPA: response regulator transcription factor [Geobacteraceae bacterium]|nr:response regulator transcription factor [Geobacteraceae bacterium]
MGAKTILIIEDDKDLAELLAYNLKNEGYHTVTAADGVAGLEAARSASPDLVLLDLMLPGMQGTDVCKLIRQDAKIAGTPVIMLTAKCEEIDQVVGFELGADDYVAKPFSIRILLLRIKAMLLRASVPRETGKVNKVGPFTIDTDRHLVIVGNREIELTPMEYNLFLTLSENIGKVHSREQLLRNVWGYNYTGDTRTVNTYITKLRAKLGSAGDLIKTVRGFGYKLAEQ